MVNSLIAQRESNSLTWKRSLVQSQLGLQVNEYKFIKIEKMENVIINVNDVKKDLYKSKVNAKFSHYSHGKLYYTVELTDGVYIFPISTIDKVTLEETTNQPIFISDDDTPTLKPFDKML